MAQGQLWVFGWGEMVLGSEFRQQSRLDMRCEALHELAAASEGKLTFANLPSGCPMPVSSIMNPFSKRRTLLRPVLAVAGVFGVAPVSHSILLLTNQTGSGLAANMKTTQLDPFLFMQPVLVCHPKCCSPAEH